MKQIGRKKGRKEAYKYGLFMQNVDNNLLAIIDAAATLSTYADDIMIKIILCNLKCCSMLLGDRLS